jgi:hypothetical protein
MHKPIRKKRLTENMALTEAAHRGGLGRAVNRGEKLVDTMVERIVYRPEVHNGLIREKHPGSSSLERAEREMEERLNRLNFAANFHYEDPWTRVNPAVTFDERGDYNCGRCNKRDGRDNCLIIPIRIEPEAGSCKHWETRCAGDREIDVSKIGHTAQAASYGVARNGQGFGCRRCPYSAQAHEPDSVGRDLYCGKGDFRVPRNACCELNGAKVVAEYVGNRPVARGTE